MKKERLKREIGWKRGEKDGKKREEGKHKLKEGNRVVKEGKKEKRGK